jgi:hypothetical protein
MAELTDVQRAKKMRKPKGLWHESDGNFRVAQSIADHFEALLGKARRCGRALMV